MEQVLDNSGISVAPPKRSRSITTTTQAIPIQPISSRARRSDAKPMTTEKHDNRNGNEDEDKGDEDKDDEDDDEDDEDEDEDEENDDNKENEDDDKENEDDNDKENDEDDDEENELGMTLENFVVIFSFFCVRCVHGQSTSQHCLGHCQHHLQHCQRCLRNCQHRLRNCQHCL